MPCRLDEGTGPKGPGNGEASQRLTHECLLPTYPEVDTRSTLPRAGMGMRTNGRRAAPGRTSGERGRAPGRGGGGGGAGLPLARRPRRTIPEGRGWTTGPAVSLTGCYCKPARRRVGPVSVFLLVRYALALRQEEAQIPSEGRVLSGSNQARALATATVRLRGANRIFMLRGAGHGQGGRVAWCPGPKRHRE